MILSSDIVTLVFFGVVLALFVWLFYDSRKEARARELAMIDERRQLISVLQQNAVQMPIIASALQQINDNLDELNKQIVPHFPSVKPRGGPNE